MSLAAVIRTNKIGAGYSGDLGARVSMSLGRSSWPENFGAQPIGGGFGGLVSGRSGATGARHRLTHFCGFAAVRGSIVGLVELVWFAQGRGIASLQALRRLMGNLQRSASLCAAAPVHRPPAPRRAGRCPPSPARARPHPLSHSCGGKFSKKFALALPTHLFSRIAPWLLQRRQLGTREIQLVQTGSGVRVARESFVTGRLACRPKCFLQWQFETFGVRVQRALSLAIGVTGIGKLCLRIGNVN